ncbi:nucleotidyltransferase [Sphingobacterium kitahiroshimense]|uniref:Nucleotidyltransferase n=1 Tax=Sphingobacterium kitahiroshimense TaxID=470446 RepID=A0ABV0C0T8_9SPHI
MATLLQSIKTLVDNITVTDKQEENILSSVNNITSTLESEDKLYIKEIFLNGSYERDTNIRPLDDIDIFAVLNEEDWVDEYGNLPNPQSVLTKVKNYLDKDSDYQGKVKQDRPCVTVELSNKSFDVLPAFEFGEIGYHIPNYDLMSWIPSYPKTLSESLATAHRNYSYKLKDIVKVIKYWNRLNNKLIPSFHIEEIAIKIVHFATFTNYEEAVRSWFTDAITHLEETKFKSSYEFENFIKKLEKSKLKIIEAKELLDSGLEIDAKKIWKDIFQKEFPIVDEEEAKNFSKSLTEGALKITQAGLLSTSMGKSVTASKGFYGDEI